MSDGSSVIPKSTTLVQAFDASCARSSWENLPKLLRETEMEWRNSKTNQVLLMGVFLSFCLSDIIQGTTSGITSFACLVAVCYSSIFIVNFFAIAVTAARGEWIRLKSMSSNTLFFRVSNEFWKRIGQNQDADSFETAIDGAILASTIFTVVQLLRPLVPGVTSIITLGTAAILLSDLVKKCLCVSPDS